LAAASLEQSHETEINIKRLDDDDVSLFYTRVCVCTRLLYIPLKKANRKLKVFGREEREREERAASSVVIIKAVAETPNL
jgi:hypothetical protein